MQHIKVIDSNDSFEGWINKEYIPENLKQPLSLASIMILPEENLRDFERPLFPVATEEVLRYFKQHLPRGIMIDICISDAGYQEFAFYSDYKRIGKFLVKTIALPVFASILSKYVYDNFIRADESKPQTVIIDKSTNVDIDVSILSDKKYLEPTSIKFSIILVDSTGNSKEIQYEGPAKEMETVLETLKEYEE